MSERHRLRRESDRLVGWSALGPIYFGSTPARLIPWATGFILLQELATRAKYPESEVTSTIAKKLSGADAYLGHSAVLGQLMAQLRRYDPWELTAVAAALATHIGRSPLPDGLEGLVATTANFLWGRASQTASNEMTELAVSITSSSRYTLDHPLFVMEKSGAVATYSAGTQLLFDDDTRRKLHEHLVELNRDVEKIKADAANSLLEELDSNGGPGSVEKLHEWVGDDLNGWTGNDEGLDSPSLGSYAAEHGLPNVGGQEDLSSLGKRVEDGSWADEPFHIEDIVTSTDRAGKSSGEGDAYQSLATGELGVVTTGLGLAFGPVGGAAGLGMQLGFYIAGAIINHLDDIEEVVIEIEIGSSEGAANPPTAPANSVNPLDDPRGTTPMAWVTKELRKVKSAGLWPPNGASDSVNMAGETTSTGRKLRQFNLVDPLWDPLDLIFADGTSSQKPPDVLVSKSDSLPRWVYVFYGSGTASFLNRVGTDKVLYTR